MDWCECVWDGGRVSESERERGLGCHLFGLGVGVHWGVCVVGERRSWGTAS